MNFNLHCHFDFSASGIFISHASFLVAINTYFQELKARAMGLAMTMQGLNSMLIPQLASFLLAKYDSQVNMIGSILQTLR